MVTTNPIISSTKNVRFQHGDQLLLSPIKKLHFYLDSTMFPSFFALLKSSAGLFGGFTPPAARQAPVVFFMVSNTTKILHFYLERAILSIFKYNLKYQHENQ